jgi:membrane-associated phospholipid phosphatase
LSSIRALSRPPIAGVCCALVIGLSGTAAAQSPPSPAVAGDGLFAVSPPLLDPLASRGESPFGVRGPLEVQPAGPPPTPRHTGIRALLKDLVEDVKHLPSRENLLWAGAGGGMALAVHPLDDNIQSAMVGNDAAETFFKPGAVIGQFPTLFATALTTYAIGRIGDKPKVSHLGMDLIQALAISEGLTQGLKYATRRERPDGSSKNSFPSGHAADTFAFATALERHLGWKGAVPAYAIASYVAVSRLPANRHWFSDVVFGSSVGIIAGRTVTRHGRAFPVTAAVGPSSIVIQYTRGHSSAAR